MDGERLRENISARRDFLKRQMDARRETFAEEILATEDTEFLEKYEYRKTFFRLLSSAANIFIKIVDGFTIQNPKSKI